MFRSFGKASCEKHMWVTGSTQKSAGSPTRMASRKMKAKMAYTSSEHDDGGKNKKEKKRALLKGKVQMA
jgi:hypothetical protein